MKARVRYTEMAAWGRKEVEGSWKNQTTLRATARRERAEKDKEIDENDERIVQDNEHSH